MLKRTYQEMDMKTQFCKPPDLSVRRATGFTLLELLVVVMIIGVLVGLVAPRFFSQVGKSEVQVARAQIDSL